MGLQEEPRGRGFTDDPPRFARPRQFPRWPGHSLESLVDVGPPRTDSKLALGKFLYPRLRLPKPLPGPDKHEPAFHAEWDRWRTDEAG